MVVPGAVGGTTTDRKAESSPSGTASGSCEQ
jgi:hypothetical protein